MTSQSKHCDDGPTPEELLLVKRQIANLQQHYPEHEIVSDIGSGLNWKRRGFVALLERIHAGGIEEVDRLCCFGSELVEWIFEKNGTQLVVLGTDVSAESNEARELAEDLLAIVTVFVARHNGLRSAANRKRRRDVAQEIKDIQEGSEETSSRQGTTDSHLSQPAGASETQKMDGNSMMDMQSVSYCILETPYDIHDEAINDLPGRCFTWGRLICDENKNVILI
ncbi:IS607 family transposase [Rhizophagus clarus]|uniref:IS607 family transposase n=1 Tax=Rhizophagus clarus TaxID=94130 RepID=A0A8H3LNH9_9GLOM|nr:IS607 family transposase [Rhizophagus clarus]